MGGASSSAPDASPHRKNRALNSCSVDGETPRGQAKGGKPSSSGATLVALSVARSFCLGACGVRQSSRRIPMGKVSQYTIYMYIYIYRRREVGRRGVARLALR